MSATRRAAIAFAVLLHVINADSACDARLVRFSFSGVVATVPPDFADKFRVGEGISGTYAFDSPASASESRENFTLYKSLIRDASVSFDSGYTAMLGQGGADQITYIGDGDGILGSFDVYDVSIPLVTTLSEQVPFNSLSLRFAGNSDWLPSLTLSETPPDLSKVSYTDAKLSAEDGYLGLDILTLSRVPEPSGVLLCVGLFGGLLLLRRKVNG